MNPPGPPSPLIYHKHPQLLLWFARGARSRQMMDKNRRINPGGGGETMEARCPHQYVHIQSRY
jgi:hypothetical protein